MASCITFNILQQISRSLSKYPSSLSSSFLSCHCLPLFLNSSPTKHTPFSVVKEHAIATASSSDMPKLSTTDPERTTKWTSPRVRKENGSGFCPLRNGGERVERQHGRHLVSSVVEEKAEKRFKKDKCRRKDMGFRKRREMDSGNSSVSSKEGKGNEKFRSLKSVRSHVVNSKMEKKANKGGDNHAKEEKERGPQKDKVEAPQIQLRAELDMCSKSGDVMGAIQLYDWAQKEGIKMGQYHYAVLLYLCSSAAIGVVQPAKSGTVSRTSSPASKVSLKELTELGARGDSNASSADYATRVSSNRLQLVNTGKSSESTNKLDSSSDSRHDNLDDTLVEQFPNGFGNMDSQHLYGLSFPKKNGIGDHEDHEIQMSEDGKMYALQRGFEIYENMCMENIPMNEATLTAVARMALAMGDGDLAFEMVKQMKPLGINPKLRSYAPALSAYCSSGDADKAFAVEKHMLEHGVCPEEAELEALLRVSTEAGKGDKVYYLLHKLRTTVRKVSPSTAGAIGRWFKSKAAMRVGKTKWDEQFIKEAIENRGGGWHGQGWLGKGKWTISCASVGSDAVCRCCGEKLALIDLDPVETENFAESVASIAIKRDKDSSFQKFQQWLDYYGPFEAVVDGANVGLFSQRRFMPSKINAVANAIRQKLPSKNLPLIVLHNKRITGRRMDEPVNKALIERWRNADVLYATPTGSNDDWYWLYAAIKFKCLVVTNDKMRDHKFQLLGNDFFPRWKERHQVHFSFADTGPVFYMPPPCSVVIQESEKGHWHIPIETEDSYEAERAWLCIRHANANVGRHNSISSRPEEPQSVPQKMDRLQLTKRTGVNIKAEPLKHGNHENGQNPAREVCKNLRSILSASGFQDHRPLLSEIESAEELGDCVIDFQI